MGFLHSLAIVLLKHPRKVVVVWALATVVGAFFALDLVDSCSFQFEPVKGTPSYVATAHFHNEFPETLYGDTEVILISCRRQCSHVSEIPFAATAAQKVREKCAELDQKNPGIISNYTDFFEFSNSAAARVAGLTGGSGINPFLASNNQTLLVQITWQVLPPEQARVQHMLDELTNLVQDLDNQGRHPPKYTNIAGESKDDDEEGSISVALTGALALFGETLVSTKQDIEAKDVYVAPVALLVLLYRVRSWRLLLLPAACLAATVATSFSLFLPFAKYVVDISPLAPTAMAFLAIALSIDYSLFLLTRFVEEVYSGASTEEAITKMLRKSGHVVGVSGCVLIICYVGVLFFPGGGIATVGFGAAFSILICMTSNLTLMPCMIASFPKFFTPKRPPSEELQAPIVAATQGGQATSTSGPRSCCQPSRKRRCWRGMAKVTTTMPGSLIVPFVVMLLLVPAVVLLFQYKESFANSLTFPRTGAASDAFSRMMKEFPASLLAPTYILVPVAQQQQQQQAMQLHIERSELNLQLLDPNQSSASLRFLAASEQPNFAGTSSVAHSSAPARVGTAAAAAAALRTSAEADAAEAEAAATRTRIAAKAFASAVQHQDDSRNYVQPSELDADDLPDYDQHYDTLCSVAQNLLKELRVAPFYMEPKHLTGLATVPDPTNTSQLVCLSWSKSQGLLPAAKDLLTMDGDVGESYRELWKQLMSHQNTSSMMLLAPPFDPFSEALRPFIAAARRALDDNKQLDGTLRLTIGEDGPFMLSSLAVVADLLEVAYARFPYILVGTTLLVFTIIAIAFRAALAPIKMFFTVVVPLAAVFGCAVGVYQMKRLAFFGVPALTSPNGAGFYWGTPIFTCTIILGLALDYEVFLFARVVELRRQGYDNVSAVRGALVLTGPIITSAGVIMAIALGGLLLCDVPANNQIGFVMSFGVLVDTFLIRTCLVPAILTLGANLNYWPQQMPEPTKGARDLERLLCGSSNPTCGSEPVAPAC